MGHKKALNRVKITIINLQEKIPVYPQRIKKSILKTIKGEGIKKEGEITICFVTDAVIRKLNFRYAKKNKPTDVLAFDLTHPENKGKLSADIIVSSDTAIRNAKIFKTSASYELNLYSIHGLLHLLDYDDRLKRDKKVMREKEAKYVHT